VGSNVWRDQADQIDPTRTHLQDLIETTAQIHYEAFRSKQLLALKESSASKQQTPAPQPNGA
jgi:septin 3/9/12